MNSELYRARWSSSTAFVALLNFCHWRLLKLYFSPCEKFRIPKDCKFSKRTQEGKLCRICTMLQEKRVSSRSNAGFMRTEYVHLKIGIVLLLQQPILENQAKPPTADKSRWVNAHEVAVTVLSSTSRSQRSQSFIGQLTSILRARGMRADGEESSQIAKN